MTDTQIVEVCDCWYHVDDTIEEPVVYLGVRDEQRRRWTVPIRGFEPYLCIPRSDAVDARDQLEYDDRVKRVEWGEKSVLGTDLAKVVVHEPSQVPELREEFISDGDGLGEQPHEDDVLFPTRFLVDNGIKTTVEVPNEALTSSFDGYIHPSDVDAASPSALEIESRVCTLDIEVEQTTGDAPAVVSKTGTEWADQPVTAIAAEDSYTERVDAWVLAHAEWSRDDVEAAANPDVPGSITLGSVRVYDDERTLLGDFCDWVATRRVDILTAWNGTSFDFPYLVNRCHERDVFGVHDLSPTGTVNTMHGEGRFLNSDLKGVELVDLLTAYKKVQRHELDSYRLADVADAEDLDVGKLDVGDIDENWRRHPSRFVEYVVRDVAAAVGIDEASGGDDGGVLR